MPLPTSWSSAINVSTTGSQTTDALLGGTRWASTSITYSFPVAGASWSTSTTTGYGPSNSGTEPWNLSFAPLSASNQVYFTAALQQWANVANLQFSQVADSSTNVGDIRAAFSYLSSYANAQAWSTTPGSSATAGDVWFNSIGSSATNSWAPGGFPFFTVLHELGHALGFKHPFYESGASNTVLPAALDTRQYSVMSYTTQANDLFRTITYNADGSLALQTSQVNPETPMVLDIAAMQYLYGANTAYHTGNEVYSFDAATPFYQTIWDAGGNDTISVGNFSEACVIDLTPGNYSSIRILSAPIPAGYTVNGGTAPTYDGSNNLGIAYGAIIENAIGGSGNDTLAGNGANNSLDGGAGNDTLYGGSGNDTFDGNASAGTGNDVFYGGAGDDVYVLDTVNDTIVEYSGEGTDEIQVSFSYSLGNLPDVENLRASSGSNGASLTGNSADNVIQGEAGDDTLDGGAGSDTLSGGLGNDTYIVDNSGDTVTESSTLAAEIDTIQSSAGYTLGANLENLTLTGTAAIDASGNALNNTLTGNSANNILDGGAGSDTLTGGLGNDTYIVDDSGDTVTEDSALADEIDTVQSSINWALGNNLENLTLTGTAALNGSGNALNNTLTGNSAGNILDGGAGNDTLTGGAGNDTLTGDTGSDTAIFFAAYAKALITYSSASGTYTVASVLDGVDLVSGIEAFAFADQSVADLNLNLAATVTGGAGNDILAGSAVNSIIDGGAGLDTITYSGSRTSFSIVQSGSNYIVSDNTGMEGTDELASVERLVFQDTQVALDIGGVAGQAYRLYQATFDRAPDIPGLTNWVSNMDAGMTLTQAADLFTQSAEFQIRYGSNPADADFVTALYANVLHRAPDPGGLINWMNQLTAHVMTKPEVLAGFSESAENYVNVVGDIQNGIALNLI